MHGEAKDAFRYPKTKRGIGETRSTKMARVTADSPTVHHAMIGLKNVVTDDTAVVRSAISPFS